MDRIQYNRDIEYLMRSGKIHAMIKADELVRKLNNLPLTAQEEQLAIIRELFGSVGSNPSISHGFRCDFGCNIHVGDNFYAGYNCTMLDFADITIGDNCLIGPNVGIYTTGHNPDPYDRHKTGYAEPVSIGNNVWIGGHACIMPGVNIGDGTIIGAGSVVTKSVPANVLAAGNPCKVLRSLTDQRI